MGCCISNILLAPQHLLSTDIVDGNEMDYQKQYLEEKNHILGAGEFGVVKLVHDIQLQQLHAQAQTQASTTATATTTSNHTFACKILQKGVVFKDNTLYTPLKPQVLLNEIMILRTLQYPNNYCLQLHAIYESSTKVYIITECCYGGTMTQYVASQHNTLFTIDDVSRISYQLLSAIDHCAKHHIIHRDIKPDNIMFVHDQPGANLRLIDFGSGCIDTPTTSVSSTLNNDLHHDTNNQQHHQYVNGYLVHKTHAGSAFYISPDVFNKSYTVMADVWSVGVTLYVLVAGYPADSLQKVFNILLCEHRDLHTLPNIPEDIPESFYTLLQGCLTYWYKQRPTAKELLSYEFINIHLQQSHTNNTNTKEDSVQVGGNDNCNNDDEVVVDDYNDGFFIEDDDDNNNDITTPMMLQQPLDNNTTTTTTTTTSASTIRRNNSISLAGSVVRHNLFLNFQQYERSITTLLATLLTKSELEQLLYVLNKRLTTTIIDKDATMVTTIQYQIQLQQQQQSQLHGLDINNGIPRSQVESLNEQQLAVVPISELKLILQEDLFHTEIVEKIESLPNSDLYDTFAYHTILLNDFIIRDSKTSDKNDDKYGTRLTLSAHKLLGSIRQMTGSNASSVHSTQSSRSNNNNNNSNNNTPNNRSSSTRRSAQQVTKNSTMFKSQSSNSLRKRTSIIQ